MRRVLLAIAAMAAMAVAVPALASIAADPQPSKAPQQDADAIVTNDDTVGKKPAHQRPQAPRYATKSKRVDPDSELGKQANPDNDPNTRVCDNGDGTVTVIKANPKPGKRAFQNDTAEERELMPC